MALLLVFAFLAGAGTAASPCVLPVLPALLSAGATGGRRRPLGIVTGLAATFTVTIVGLAALVDGVGLGASTTRTVAIVVLAAFGVAVAVPAAGARLEAPLSRLARFGPRSGGRGFWSGLAVGAALGFVYAPCAGPILAAVVSVSAASGRTIAVGLGYALGSAAVLLVLAVAGRAAVERLRRGARGPALQRALGAVMVLTSVAMALQLDVRFQSAIAAHLPAALVDPARPLEDSRAVAQRLGSLRRASRFEAAARVGARVELPDHGRAPDFTGNARWFNTPGGRPLSLATLRGRVVLVDFWTYTCINCIRTLPHLEAWDRAYRRAGLTIVGVHSPEFSFEHDAGNVAAAIRQDGIRYPVAQDNALATWNAWGNEYWPAEYLIDPAGHVRHVHFGEGGYAQTEGAIRALLAQSGARLGADARPSRTFDPASQTTPETYLGLARAPVHGPFGFFGGWRHTQEAAVAERGAVLLGHVVGKDVYVVLSPPAHGAGMVRVEVDGRYERTVRVRGQRLYHLVSRPRTGRYELMLRFSRGVAGYAFTFG